MSTADATGIGIGSVWDELVAGVPVGVLLLDSHGAVLAGNDLAVELLGGDVTPWRAGQYPAGWQLRDEGGCALPAPADLAAQVLRINAPLAIPITLARPEAAPLRLWVSYQPAGRGLLLVTLRPVHTDVGTTHGLLDGLTGLPTRTLLTDRLGQALVRAHTHGTLVSAVLLDVRGMSEVNREFGFRRGDELLVMIAGRLRAGLRADHTVARYAGDRFAVLAEHPTGTGAGVATRTAELVGRSVRLGSGRLRPRVRLCWLTTDGSQPTHEVLTDLETRLGATP